MTSDKRHDDEVRALDRPGAGPSRESLVPASYAEKAMSSLLRLHEDLVEEKEKRIDLYRRLMEREQSLAEMRAYMKLLESELARRGFDPTAYAIDPVSAPAPTAEKHQAAAVAIARQAAEGARAEAPPVARQAAEAPLPPAAEAPPARQAAEAWRPTAAEAPPVLRPAAREAPPPTESQAPMAPQPTAPAAPDVPAPARRQVPAPPPAPVARGESFGSPVIAWTPGTGGPGNVR